MTSYHFLHHTTSSMDELLIAALKNGDMQALGELYSKYRNEFLSMLRSKYRVSSDGLTDVYQVAVLRLYDNVVKGKMTMMHDSIKPYLFSIGINVYKEMVRGDLRRPGHGYPLEWAEQKDESGDEYEAAVLKEKLLEASMNAIEALGEPCRGILTRFYYFKASMQQLMEEFAYKNEASVKNKKYKCLQTLREMLVSEKVKLAIA